MENIVIIGSGPAGLTAAIYAARANLAPLVIEGLQPGGQLTQTTDIENFPGFPQGVGGTALMDAMRSQAERFGTRFMMEEVVRVTEGSAPPTENGMATPLPPTAAQRPSLLCTLSMGETIATKTLIIASGASARWLDVPSEKAFVGKGISACATCDGAFFKEQDVAVVGGGDTAMEDALYLTRICRSVTVIHRRDAFRASKVMAERLLENPKVNVAWNAVVEECVGGADGFLRAVRLKDTRNGERSELPVTGLFVAIGHAPNTKAFEGIVDMDAEGYIVADAQCRTNVPGIFAAGDVADRHYRQAIVAAGTGCAAALEAERYLAHF